VFDSHQVHHFYMESKFNNLINTLKSSYLNEHQADVQEDQSLKKEMFDIIASKQIDASINQQIVDEIFAAVQRHLEKTKNL